MPKRSQIINCLVIIPLLVLSACKSEEQQVSDEIGESMRRLEQMQDRLDSLQRSADHIFENADSTMDSQP